MDKSGTGLRVAFAALAILGCAGPGQAQSTGSGSEEIMVASAGLGFLSDECKKFQSPGKCGFSAGETRSYNVDILSKKCLSAKTSSSGPVEIDFKPKKTRLFMSDCRIALGRVDLRSGQVIQIVATSKTADGKPIPIRIAIRKN
jgi:hypothetical protein